MIMPDELTAYPEHKCVGAIIIRDEFILLGKRSAERDFYPHVWDVFGGHIEPREPLQRTLRRELGEELGIVPTRWHYLETLRGADSTGRVECHFFVVTGWRGAPRNNQPQEHSEVRWFRFEEVTRLELAHSEYLRILRKAVTG